MYIRHDTGATLREATDRALRSLMEEYDISRDYARKLLAEALVHNSVWDEVLSHCEWQMSRR